MTSLPECIGIWLGAFISQEEKHLLMELYFFIAPASKTVKNLIINYMYIPRCIWIRFVSTFGKENNYITFDLFGELWFAI